jgi:CarD family transcriptional regulator
MFQVGSKVVHPCYGAGIVVRIQEKSIGDTIHPYYVIDTVSRPMQLMVPVSRADEISLRPVGKADDLRSCLEICSEPPAEDEISKDLRARQAIMRDQLKSGVFPDIVGVARILYFMNNRRPLGTIDRQLFDQGKDFLAGELALASELQIEQAKQEVENQLMSMFHPVEEQDVLPQ